MSKVLCLANSRKEHQRCVAGIDLETGRLVRPVSRTDSQAIPKPWTIIDDQPVRPLDIVDIPFERGSASDLAQSENRYCHEPWTRVGRATAENLRRFRQNSRLMLNTSLDEAIPERCVKLLHRIQGRVKSLQLIEAQNIEFECRQTDHWWARFSARGSAPYELRLTDDLFIQEMLTGQTSKKSDHAYLLLSLTRPWKHRLAPKDKPRKCYKLVAGVIPANS